MAKGRRAIGYSGSFIRGCGRLKHWPSRPGFCFDLAEFTLCTLIVLPHLSRT